MFSPSTARIDLPSMPVTLTCILQITRNDDASPQDLADAVMTDQALTAKVLRLANSAYFRRAKPVNTVIEAILTLGFGYVRNLAASATVIDTLFPRRAFPWFDWQSMWVHSVTCAVASETIAVYRSGTHRRGDEAAFVAGLLHDIGKLTIASALPVQFLSIIEACHARRERMIDVEHEFLGTNHACVGRQLADNWGLPANLGQGIGWHHSPQCAFRHVELARAVSAGNMLSERLAGPCIPGTQSNISFREIAEAADIDPDSMEFIVNDVRTGVKRSAELLSWGRNMPQNTRNAA